MKIILVWPINISALMIRICNNLRKNGSVYNCKIGTTKVDLPTELQLT